MLNKIAKSTAITPIQQNYRKLSTPNKNTNFNAYRERVWQLLLKHRTPLCSATTFGMGYTYANMNKQSPELIAATEKRNIAWLKWAEENPLQAKLLERRNYCVKAGVATDTSATGFEARSEIPPDLANLLNQPK